MFDGHNRFWTLVSWRVCNNQSLPLIYAGTAESLPLEWRPVWYVRYFFGVYHNFFMVRITLYCSKLESLWLSVTFTLVYFFRASLKRIPNCSQMCPKVYLRFFTRGSTHFYALLDCSDVIDIIQPPANMLLLRALTKAILNMVLWFYGFF